MRVAGLRWASQRSQPQGINFDPPPSLKFNNLAKSLHTSIRAPQFLSAVLKLGRRFMRQPCSTPRRSPGRSSAHTGTFSGLPHASGTQDASPNSGKSFPFSAEMPFGDADLRRHPVAGASACQPRNPEGSCRRNSRNPSRFNVRLPKNRPILPAFHDLLPKNS